MKFRAIKFAATACTLASLCLHSAQAEAIFASVKSTGMAATSISYPLDTLAGAYNPGGTFSVGDRLDVEGAWVHNTGSAKVTGNVIPIVPPGIPGAGTLNPLVNGSRSGMQFKNVGTASFGINKNWCLGCDWAVSTGLVIYNRNFQKTTYKEPLVLFGTSKAGLEYVNETISPIVSLTWCCSHTIGISANYQLERIKVNGLQNFDRFPLTIDPGHVTNRGYNYAHGWGFTIGYYGRLTDALSVGLTYQPKTSMSRLDKYTGFLAHRGRLDVPPKIGAGIAYRFTPCFAVAFDVEKIEWTKIKSLSNPLLPAGGFIPNPLGANNGPGFGFRDQWYYRFGVEWTIDECWTVRCGFRHANSPIKRSQTAVNVLTLDCVENFATVGATYNLNCCNEISVMGAWGFQKEIKGKNSNPLIFGGGETDLKEQKYAIGLAWGWKY